MILQTLKMHILPLFDVDQPFWGILLICWRSILTVNLQCLRRFGVILQSLEMHILLLFDVDPPFWGICFYMLEEHFNCKFTVFAHIWCDFAIP